MNELLPWLILLLPLAAAAGITLFTLRDRAASARLSIGASVIGFLASLLLFARGAVGETRFPWLDFGGGAEGLLVDLGLRLDMLSLMMLLVVTGVGSLIHIYSNGYMHDDPCVGRYFAGLSLFMFSMLGIVMANNFLMMFVFWELVGVSSYLLIGFWYDRPSAADAAKKAFLTNRVGDFGFLLGIILVWGALGSVRFEELKRILVANPQALGALGTAAGLLIFCGAAGKSAQFPLHVWLPDAMEGPTPVSALIHAATMVAAGVYMLCRSFFLLDLPGSHALEVIAWIGGITALLAALMATQQSDIKRILAYSTLSQLGLMVLGIGVAGGADGGPAASMFHLTTHAFFKALLFLGAGAVIHALHHEQDIWRMGGLTRKLPITFGTFAIGTAALCGLPPFSGFYSKDSILALAAHGHTALFGLAVVVTLLTAFYMGRLVMVAFIGPSKSQAPDHAHEVPAVMTVPLLALAVPSLLSGFWGIEGLFTAAFGHEIERMAWPHEILAPFHHAPLAAGAGLAAALVGLGAAWLLYRGAIQDPLPGMLGAASRWCRDRFYFDELYDRIIATTQDALATVADVLDRWVVAGLFVKGTHGMVELFGRVLRLVQTGNLQTYAFLLVAGVVVLLLAMMLR